MAPSDDTLQRTLGPRGSVPMRSPRDVKLELRRQDVHDRRWLRHRDQLLTVVAIVALVLSALLGIYTLGVVAALSATSPALRAFVRWRSARDAPPT